MNNNVKFSCEYIFIGTYTYQHENGLTNFVSRNRLLGYSIGNYLDKSSFYITLDTKLFDAKIMYSYLRVAKHTE